jgi:hypothetical protein
MQRQRGSTWGSPACETEPSVRGAPLDIASEPGHGTTVSVSLPIRWPSPIRWATARAAAPGPQRSPGPEALVSTVSRRRSRQVLAIGRPSRRGLARSLFGTAIRVASGDCTELHRRVVPSVTSSAVGVAYLVGRTGQSRRSRTRLGSSLSAESRPDGSRPDSFRSRRSPASPVQEDALPDSPCHGSPGGLWGRRSGTT